MNNTNNLVSERYWTVLVLILIHFIDVANAQHFNDGLLDRVRSASTMIPGDRPVEVRFQSFYQFNGPLSSWVEGASTDTVPAVIGVFQLNFRDGWVIVDTGTPQKNLWSDEFSEEDFATVGQAIRRANLVLVTHEHHDHVGGIVNGPWMNYALEQTLLTTEQLDTMVDGPVNHPSIRMTREQADKFMSVYYNDLLPIAPGVVLIKASGHTPGSQMVFVTLVDGREILLVGDVVWMMAAIQEDAQKPIEISRRLSENRALLAEQLDWLQQVQPELTVVVAHDANWLAKLIEEGILVQGLRISR